MTPTNTPLSHEAPQSHRQIKYLSRIRPDVIEGPDAPHRVLKSAVVAGEALGTTQVWTPDWPTATYTGAAEARALYAGQSVGGVRKRQSAAEIVAELVGEAEMRLTQTVY
jgi:hypothetical protein